MPIVYLHGVSIRDYTAWDPIERLLRRYVAPAISNQPDKMAINYCYWGDHGARFRFDGASKPSSPLKVLLAGRREAFENRKQRLVEMASKSAEFIESARGLPRTRKALSKIVPAAMRLKDLSKDRLSDLCAAAIGMRELSAEETALAKLAADEVAHEEETQALLENCGEFEEEVSLMQRLVRERYNKLRVELGGTFRAPLPEWKARISLKLYENMARLLHSPGFAVTRAAAEMRSPMHTFVTLFLGDVFAYLSTRGDASHPGPIPQYVMRAIALANEEKLDPDEPLVVMTHSMGGQIVYDVVSHFLPNTACYENVKVDFWCASASQVGFFEELKLFVESSEDYCSANGKLVPFPDRRHLGYWWNVWDHNDFVSYSTNGIFEGVDDEPYNTGMFAVDAHGGYLSLPSFFRKFASKVSYARQLQQATGQS